MTWHWDVVPRNFEYFMMGRLSYAGLAWWGVVTVAFTLFCFLAVRLYGHQSHGNRRARNGYAALLALEIVLIAFFGRRIGRGIELLNLGGFLLTLIMSAVVIIATFFVGIVVGLMRSAKNRLVSVPSILYIEIIRGGPLLMGIFWFYFLLPQIFPRLKGVPQAELLFATVALIAFYGAYMAETVRAGIHSIPHGQLEAALASGLSTGQAFAYVILPQGMKNMIPAIVGNFIAVVKDTSLIYIIGVAEFTRTIFQVNNREMNAPMELFIFAAVVYFVPCWILSKVSLALERKLAAGQKRR